jgi:predicted MPP superfamily phosphohydrolase
MKTIALGDTHGRSKWKDIVEKEKGADKIIFIGDYFDAKDGGYSANRQIENFKDIIKFKRNNPDKVILLIGNHDFHYLKGVDEEYSSFQFGYSKDINQVLQPVVDEGLLQICHQENKYFFSHAGVTKTWCDKSKIDKNNLQESINNLFKTNIERFRFTMGDNLSFGGNDVTQPPIWVRPQSLVKDMVEGIVCVVGHSQVNNVTIMEDDNLILIDCLGFTDSYLIIENNIPIIGSI